MNKRKQIAIALIKSDFVGYSSLVHPAFASSKQMASIAEIMDTALSDADALIRILNDAGLVIKRAPQDKEKV